MSDISTQQRQIYNGLDPSNDEIRLLSLQPARRRGAPVTCSLTTVSLKDSPTYEALSYVWGDPTPVKSLLVDGQTLGVPYSTWEVLQELRYTCKCRTVWIDAVCINQSDVEERTAQVQLMGQIYKLASSVRVWLGPASDSDNRAIKILRGMKDAEAVRSTLRSRRKHDIDRKEQLTCFFKRPWWERLWVIQEVALGQNVVFQQGTAELTFDELLNAYETTVSYYSEHLSGFQYGSYGNDDDFIELFRSALVLEQARRLFQTYSAGNNQRGNQYAIMTWMTIANLLRVRKATDDHDHLYSLYGLLPPTIVELPGMQPSYTTTTEMAFTDVTYALMKASRSLMLFNHLGRRSTSDPASLPSWVPDWRLPPVDHYESNARVERETLFNASNSAPFYIRRLSASTLCLKGCFVDVIGRWAPKPLLATASPILDGIYDSWRGDWTDAAQASGWEIESQIPNLEGMFRRTVLYDCAPGPENGKLRRLTPLACQTMWSVHERAVAIAFGEDDELAGQTLSVEDAKRADYMMTCAKARTFFVTASLFMGMTQAHVQPGDHVFIVAGNSHPVILRPSSRYSDTWTAVGECYLGRFMDGEGLGNRDVFEAHFEHISAHEGLRALKETERNPRWDEVEEQCVGPWRWLLVE